MELVKKCFLNVLFYKFVAPGIEIDTKTGKTVGYVYCGDALAGMFSLSDACRTGVADAVTELKSLGVKTAMLTGDSQSAAMHAQEQVQLILFYFACYCQF